MISNKSTIEKIITELCPNGVEFKELGKIGTLIRGSGLPKTDFTESGVGCIHYGQIYTHYEIFAVTTKSFVSHKTAEKLKKVNKNDLIITSTSENIQDVCKAVAWLGDDEIVTGGHATILKHQENPKFISYYLQTPSFSEQKKKWAKGTKVIDVSAKDLAKIKIPVPPLPIQEEIVKILDTFTELEAELEAELESRKKQYEYYYQKLLNFKSEVPLKTVNEIAFFRNGKGHEKNIDESGQYIVVNSKFVSTAGKIKKYSKAQLCPVYKDDILMVMSDLPNGKALARCFFTEEDDKYTLNQRICALTARIKEKIIPKYLYYALNRNAALLRYDNGVDQTNLRKDDILKIKIPVPKVDEQERIVSILDKFDALVNDISVGLPAELDARRKQYEYYRDKLLTFKEYEN